MIAKMDPLPSTVSALKKYILSNLTMEQYDNYVYFYGFVETQNRQATDLWPISEDVDKKIEIMQFMYKQLKANTDIPVFFDALRALMTDLDIAYNMDNYVIVKGKIAKIIDMF